MALVQSMTPENPVIAMAARQDYDGFYAMELPLRQLRGCPPFADIITVTFSGLEEDAVSNGALLFRSWLLAALPSTGLSIRVMGPAPASVAKIMGRYRYRLTLSLQNSREARQLLSHLLKQFLKDNKQRGVHAFIDINPYE